MQLYESWQKVGTLPRPKGEMAKGGTAAFAERCPPNGFLSAEIIANCARVCRKSGRILAG